MTIGADLVKAAPDLDAAVIAMGTRPPPPVELPITMVNKGSPCLVVVSDSLEPTTPIFKADVSTRSCDSVSSIDSSHSSSSLQTLTSSSSSARASSYHQSLSGLTDLSRLATIDLHGSSRAVGSVSSTSPRSWFLTTTTTTTATTATATTTTTATTATSGVNHKRTPFPLLFFMSSTAQPLALQQQQQQQHQPMHVLLEGVDHMLTESCQTDTDCKILLRGMVADLLQEVDRLQEQADNAMQKLEQQKELVSVYEKEQKEKAHIQMQQLIDVLKCIASDSSLNKNACDIQVAKKNDDNCVIAQQSSQDEAIQMITIKIQQGETLTIDEAAQLTIQTMAKKIENLNEQNNVLQQDYNNMRERMEDMESEQQASMHKVQALETQFKSINRTRHKVVNRLLTDRSNELLPTTMRKV